MSYFVNQKVAKSTRNEIRSRWRARRPSWDTVEEAVQAFVLDGATVVRTSPKHIVKTGSCSLSGRRSRCEDQVAQAGKMPGRSCAQYRSLLEWPPRPSRKNMMLVFFLSIFHLLLCWSSTWRNSFKWIHQFKRAVQGKALWYQTHLQLLNVLVKDLTNSSSPHQQTWSLMDRRNSNQTKIK